MNKDFSLIDANIARIKEGLRVLEDVSRFQLKHRYSFSELKKIRHILVSLEHHIGVAGLIQSRRGGDIGEDESPVESEYIRSTTWSIVRANVGRVTQAFRVIEEFIKIYKPGIAKDVEELRYKMYSLEKIILEQTPHYWMHRYFEKGSIYAISDEPDDLIYFVERGARVVQLRDKKNSKQIIYEKALQFCRFLHEERMLIGNTNPVIFIINDHADIAAKLPVSGVHIGQFDGDINKTRRSIGSNKIIGRSNQTVEQLDNSIQKGSDYVSFGPIFATETKPEREPVGLETLQSVVDHVEIPLVAIGGINKKTYEDVYRTGVNNIAVVSGAREFFK